MVDSFAQAYHWTMKDILSLSMGQVILLNHGGKVNGDRFNANMKSRDTGDKTLGRTNFEEVETDGVTFEGKPLEQLNSEEYARYLQS